jgi:hypothetical protein
MVYDFRWSGVLAGVVTTLPGDPAEAANGADEGALLPWLDAGEKLLLYLEVNALDHDPDLVVWSHSHGLQVVTFACIKGAQFKTAFSISGPIRRDMLRARRIAAARIGTWVQFADPTGTDKTIIEGQWHDGTWPLRAEFTLPEGLTIDTPDSGHSGLVQDAALRARYRLWETIPA